MDGKGGQIEEGRGRGKEGGGREGERGSHLSETHKELLTFVVSIENDWVAGAGGRESRAKDALGCTSFLYLMNFDPCELYSVYKIIV